MARIQEIKQKSSVFQKLFRTIRISGNFWARSWAHSLPLPTDAIQDTVRARVNRGTLYISAQLQEPYHSGKDIPINKE